MVDLTVAAETCVALGATEHQFESFPGRDIALGALTVTRVLPVKGRRLVGPWCFLDRFGPLTFANPSPMSDDAVHSGNAGKDRSHGAEPGRVLFQSPRSGCLV